MADLGFGSGRTTDTLNQLVQPEGSVVAVDIVPERVEVAKRHYNSPTIDYVCRSVCDSLDDLGRFDSILSESALCLNIIDRKALKLLKISPEI